MLLIFHSHEMQIIAEEIEVRIILVFWNSMQCVIRKKFCTNGVICSGLASEVRVL